MARYFLSSFLNSQRFLQYYFIQHQQQHNMFTFTFISIIYKFHMSSSINIDRTSVGKTRWHTQLFLILIFQCGFYGSIVIILYALATLNVRLMIFLIVFSFLQSFAKKSEWVIGLINKYIDPLNYYRSFKRIYQQQIPDDVSALFSLHPHSVLSYCMPSSLNADQSKMSRMTGLASRALLHLPFIGLQIRLWGIESVNHKNIRKLMQKKKTIGLLPGGFQQATLTTPNQLRIFIKDRKGFVKYALQYDYTVYPVLVYNQHKAYWTLDSFKTVRMWLNKIKMPGVVFGMGFLWLFLPFNIDMIQIVGKGIKRKPENIGKEILREEINQFHQRYIKQIERMHAKHKEEYKESELVIY